MSRSQVAVLVGTSAALAVLALVRAFAVPATTIPQLRRRLAASAPGSPAVTARRSHRLARSLASGPLGDRLAIWYGPQLRAAGTTVPDVVARALAAAALSAVATMAVAAGLAAMGAGLPVVLLALGVPAAAVVGAATVLARLRRLAWREHQAFQHMVADFIGLVAVCLTSGRSIEEAVRYAVEVGEGRAFTALREAVVTAPLVGRTVWEALEGVATEWHVAELANLATSVERAAVIGASVADTVSGLAEASRARQLDELERRADQANVQMLAPTYVFVAGFIAFLLYPLVVRISGAGL